MRNLILFIVVVILCLLAFAAVAFVGEKIGAFDWMFSDNNRLQVAQAEAAQAQAEARQIEAKTEILRVQAAHAQNMERLRQDAARENWYQSHIEGQDRQQLALMFLTILGATVGPSALVFLVAFAYFFRQYTNNA